MSEATATRRQRLSADERRTQIVTGTVQVLAEHGYGGATADRIARRAGVSKGLLWHYFADVDDLMEQTARRTLVVLLQHVGGSLDLAAPVPELIRAAVRAAAQLRVTHGAERRAINEIVLNLRESDGTLRLGVRDYADMHAAQAAIFRRGQEEGDIRASLDPQLLAVTYQSAVDGMLDYLDEHPQLDADAYAALVADVLLAGAGT